jgi:hypothetical protein
MVRVTQKLLVAVALAATATQPVLGQVPFLSEKKDMAPAKKQFSPYAHRDRYPTRVFFGDTHLHTALSMDAGTFGNRLGLDEACRFTRREVVTSSTGVGARLGRPLDFVLLKLSTVEEVPVVSPRQFWEMLRSSKV